VKRCLRFSRLFKYYLVLCLVFPLPLLSQVRAIKAKKIYTISHGVIENGVILIKDGKIEDLGAGIPIPWNAEVVDYSQKIIMPGLIEAHAARGYDLANESNPLTPFVTVLDNLDPSHDSIQMALRNGVTTMNIMPGNVTIFGGKGALIKTAGLVVGDMLLLPNSGMKISVAGTPMQTRMGVMAQLRRYFNETKEYLEKKEKAAPAEGKDKMVSTPGSFRSPESVKYEAVADLLKGRYRAFVYCPTASDVVHAQELGERNNYQSVFLLGPESYKAVDFISQKKLKIILDPELEYFERDPVSEEFKKISVAKAFFDKGIEFALQSDPEKIQARSLLYQAMKAVGSGVSPEVALKSITLIPAQVLDIETIVGSLDKGKIANLIVLDDEPLTLSGKIEYVLIEGKVVYDRTKDEELKDLTNPKISQHP